MEIWLEVQKGCLRCAGLPDVVVGHRQALRFLTLLVLRAGTAAPHVTAADVAQLWQTSAAPLALARLPDRTALRRLVHAVEAALAQIAGQPARLHYAPRHKTTGPWWLVSAPRVVWQLGKAASARSPQARQPGAPPTLLAAAWQPSETRLRAVVDVTWAMALAEDGMRRGDYGACVQHYQQMLLRPALGDAMEVLIGLRLIRALRRTGQFEQAAAVLEKTAARAGQCAGRIPENLQGECDVLMAWLRFEISRRSAVMQLDFAKLWQQTGHTGWPGLLGQSANLHALALRRKLEQAHLKSAPVHEREQIHVQLAALFEAALFWLLQDGDMYGLQATLINLGDYLCRAGTIWLCESTAQAQLIDAGLQAFTTGHRLVDRFDLPQDSAWDFIMLGLHYLGSPHIREQLVAQPELWPDNNSPATARFYERSLEVAQACGDMRQIITAWDQLAQWHQQYGHKTRARQAEEHVQWLMQEHTALAADMRQDGFAPAVTVCGA